MPSGSFTISVVPEQEEDWQGDPIGDAPAARNIDDVALIPRTQPDDDTIVIDGYQIVITDTDQDPPAAEDTIKILDHPLVDPAKSWFIDGGIAPYTKMSGDLKAIMFVVKSVR
jgi:hypothetical protein